MDLRESILNQTDVSASLSKHVISTLGTHLGRDINVVFSPLSIHIVLGLIATGSSGPTRDQLLGFLRSKSTDELNSLSSQLVATIFSDGGPLGGPHLSSANGVWVDQSLSLKSDFKKLVENEYKAVSNVADFQTKAVEVPKEVNTWADKETNGLIKEILPSDSVNTTTRLIFSNAVSFKGLFDEEFDDSNTKEDNFFLLDGTPVKALFMASQEKRYIRVFDDFRVLRLPYKQGEDKRKFSIYFFLPHDKEGLPSLLEKFGTEPRFIERHLPNELVKVGDFRIPKFKIDFGFEASEVLKGLGVTLPFSGESGLTEMVDDSNVGKNLSVSSIFHKSFIEVREGIESAASKAGEVRLRCFIVEESTDFLADHPFVFVIREDTTGVVFLIGQVQNPLD